MEAPQTPPSPGGAAPAAELVVVGGRLAGTRRPLSGPLTLFGQAPGCEVRLTVEGVQPLHAALVHGPDGFLLRDLAGDGGVLVNDRPASLAPLREGDEINVGPFRFRLEAVAPVGAQAAEAERDALRVQAAAVVAQQTALNEEEARLHQRRGALEQQEEQLAARLEERRRRLVELQEQTRQEREAFQVARAAAEAEQAAVKKELHGERDATAAAGKQVRAERLRLKALRKRLRRRWRRHWDQKEADLARREKELSAREGRLEQEGAKLDRAGRLAAEQLRIAAEAELARRQAREQGQELALAHQEWEACLNQERAERDRRDRELDARAAALAEAEQTWAGRERSVRLALAELHRESAGLEARVRNQREKLAEEEEAVARLRAERGAEFPAPVILPAPAAEEPSPADGARAAYLERVAGRLADQRAHLLEQWQALLRVQEEWRRDREQALAEVEATGRSLHEREQRLAAQERKLDATTAECRARQQSLSQMRYSLEGWQARLKARDLAWEAERAALTAEVRAREEATGFQLQRLQELARRRELERGREAEGLAAARSRCEELRRRYAALWKECRRRGAELARDQRDLAARTLAVEQLRVEVVGKSDHSARAERCMERLRHRNLARIEASEREIDAARQSLTDEGGRLDELAGFLQRQQNELAARQATLTREQAAWEERRVAAEDADERRRLELQRLLVRREQDEQVIAQLREDVERVAGLLMEQAETPSAQAA